MNVKQKITRYLDKLSRDIIITSKRIAHSADLKGDVLDYRYVTKVMTELVEAGEWETIRCWSSDGHTAYRRVNK